MAISLAKGKKRRGRGPRCDSRKTVSDRILKVVSFRISGFEKCAQLNEHERTVPQDLSVVFVECVVFSGSIRCKTAINTGKTQGMYSKAQSMYDR